MSGLGRTRNVLVGAANPGGWLFRVGQSRARVYTRWFRRRAPIELLPEGAIGEPNADLIDLFRCLGQLNDAQRVAVVLVHGHGERYEDAAQILGVSTAAVTNHIHRGLRKLRFLMEEEDA